MTVTSYRDLIVWKEGMRLTISIYHLTDGFPEHERFGLVSQLRRAAVSIPSNVAEGHAKVSTRDFMRHVSIAMGSLAEIETQLYLARELDYASPEAVKELHLDTDRLGKQLRNLVKSLRSRLDQTT